MISVVIPTFRSGEKLERTLASLQPYAEMLDLCIVDTEDCSDTVLLKERYPELRWLSAAKGRASQQNAGASAARGDILLFLHSDTRLEGGWIEAVEQAVRAPGFVLGAFRFTMDQPGFGFRLIEASIRLRSRLFQLPYGDQGLFTTRETFDRLGGFPDLALMEDVALVSNARKIGRITQVPLKAITSAERWQRDGICKRTWINWRTYYHYHRGRMSSDALFDLYENRSGRLVVFAKRPDPGKVKTRLAATIGDERAVEIYRQLVEYTLEQARSVRARVEVHFAPADAEADMRAWLGDDLSYVAQPEGDLGARMLAAFTGDTPTVIIGTDCPGLNRSLMDEAFNRLEAADLVLGPTEDGGYYLIGARGPHVELFRDVPWSTDEVFRVTCERADSLGLRVAELPRLNDVDVEADLLS